MCSDDLDPCSNVRILVRMFGYLFECSDRGAETGSCTCTTLLWERGTKPARAVREPPSAGSAEARTVCEMMERLRAVRCPLFRASPKEGVSDVFYEF